MQLRTIELGYTPDEVQDNRALPNVSKQFKTFERSYMIQCVQDHQTLRCLSGVQDPALRTLGPCYIFQRSASLRNFAIRFYAVHYFLTLLCFSIQVKT